MTRRSFTAVPVLVLVSTACVDTAGRFQEFVDRVGPIEAGAAGAEDAAARGDGGCIDLADAEGTYILALSVSIAPATPIVARMSLVAEGDDAVTFVDVQPLSAADRETPVGPSISLGPYPVGADGVVSVDAPGLAVTGAANPITQSDIEADLAFDIDLCGAREPFCGSVTGQVSQPLTLDLAGSTYTLSPVADGAGAPTPLPINCAGAVADPI